MDKIAIIGLGYVGLPLARLFATKHSVVGFDINPERIRSLSEPFPCVCDVEALRDCTVYIVAVPTPVDHNNRPDLEPLLRASEIVGGVIGKGNLVVYESTVYPGVTEEECLPVVERVSGMRLNHDFQAGYSPERINPGDTEHTVERIVKVTSGSTPEAAERVDSLYRSVLLNGTYRAPSIRVAEAAKIIENSQRDVNIAFINELAKIFNAMGIDTNDVIDAAATKWNFLPLRPGLVGGHCISVDPYYLIEKAQVYGVLPRVMSNARRLNDGMGAYVAQQLVHHMCLKGLTVKDSRILILGYTFKENCPDTRNTKILDIYHTLRQYTSRIDIYDPWVEQYKAAPRGTYDACILAVAHEQFRAIDIRALVPEPGVVYDVKNFFPRDLVDARL